MKNVQLTAVRLAVILALVGGGLWLFNKNFPLTGELTVVAWWGEDQPALSRLGPDPRLKIEGSRQVMVEGPVYFDLRSMPWFDRAVIDVVYREEGRQFNGLGGLVAEPWSYYLRSPQTVKTLGDGWQRATFEFDLNPLLVKKNVRRFIFDTTGETGQRLTLRSLVIKLYQ